MYTILITFTSFHSMELRFVATVTNVPVSLCDDCLLALTFILTWPQGKEPLAKRALCVPRNNSNNARRNRLWRRPYIKGSIALFRKAIHLKEIVTVWLSDKPFSLSSRMRSVVYGAKQHKNAPITKRIFLAALNSRWRLDSVDRVHEQVRDVLR